MSGETFTVSALNAEGQRIRFQRPGPVADIIESCARVGYQDAVICDGKNQQVHPSPYQVEANLARRSGTLFSSSQVDAPTATSEVSSAPTDRPAQERYRSVVWWVVYVRFVARTLSLLAALSVIIAFFSGISAAAPASDPGGKAASLIMAAGVIGVVLMTLAVLVIWGVIEMAVVLVVSAAHSAALIEAQNGPTTSCMRE
jgi:small-conductance mechanosensitive channel